MPYILVNYMLDLFSLIFFCATSAALLWKVPFGKRFLPARPKEDKKAAWVAQGAVFLVLSIVIVGVGIRHRYSYSFSPYLYDVLSFIGLANCTVLAYRSLERRCFTSMPALRRRLLLGFISVVVTVIPFLAVVVAIVGLFIIK